MKACRYFVTATWERANGLPWQSGQRTTSAHYGQSDSMRGARIIAGRAVRALKAVPEYAEVKAQICDIERDSLPVEIFS